MFFLFSFRQDVCHLGSVFTNPYMKDIKFLKSLSSGLVLGFEEERTSPDHLPISRGTGNDQKHLSLSLSLTHTHTHTHTLLFYADTSFCWFFWTTAALNRRTARNWTRKKRGNAFNATILFDTSYFICDARSTLGCSASSLSRCHDHIFCCLFLNRQI